MELRHLRYFCAVADWNGFNRAARALHTSQSSISAQIRDLEQEIGVKLLNRTQSQVTLTIAGESFLEESRKVVAAADRAVDVHALRVRAAMVERPGHRAEPIRVDRATRGRDPADPAHG